MDSQLKCHLAYDMQEVSQEEVVTPACTQRECSVTFVVHLNGLNNEWMPALITLF